MSLRAKLIAMALAIAVTFLLLIGASLATASRVNSRLKYLQHQQLPRLEVGPKLERALESLVRSFQDAVAAKDASALEATREFEQELLVQLEASKPWMDEAQARPLRAAIVDYAASARTVSRRMLEGESGEGLFEALEQTQQKQKRAFERLRSAIAFDRAALSDAFGEVIDLQEKNSTIRLVISVLCMAIVLMLMLWLSRGLLQTVAVLQAGLERFGTGNFEQPIVLPGNDELNRVGRSANAMAQNLERLANARDREDWLKAGLAGLTERLRGELEPTEAAHRMLEFLAGHLASPVGALYAVEPSGALSLLASLGAEAEEKLRPGEGLGGTAIATRQVTLVREIPSGHLQARSGLGTSSPSTLVLVPLLSSGQPRGLLELGFFRAVEARDEQLLERVRETAAIALEVSLSRSRMRELLAETRQQADRLAVQEEELRSQNEELEAQQDELKRSNQELATVSSYKSQFLTNMSHELRTPLNSMLLLSGLLAENEAGRLDARQVEFCNTIHAAGKDLLALINQLLDLAKIESGKQELHLGPVALADFTERVRRVFGPLAREKKLELVIEERPGVPQQLVTDRQRVDQILTNLIGNAIKFTASGSVKLTVQPAAHGLAFVVTDTGDGIAPEHQHRVFAPFEQADGKVDRKYGGTGLGLTISKELAGLLGGTLRLEKSALQQGSTFVLELPRVSEGPERPPEPQPARLIAAAASKPGTLLLVEDDRTFANTFAEVIESQGLDCVVAHDGAQGLKLARELLPAGVILDVKLPDMSGFQVMEQLKADAATRDIPVHFVSALPAENRALALGAVGYLTKPTHRAELIRVVNTLAPGGHDSTRVLVVEDDTTTSDSLLRLLSNEALSADRAGTAQEALDALAQRHYGCLILDLSLPDMDGLELLGLIQQRAGPRMPTVVVYTARALSKQETQRLEAYVDAIVLKEGTSFERLLGELRLFVRRMRGAPPEAEAPPAPQVKLNGRRLLVADDDMRTVYALAAMLRARGAQVLVADTGLAAVEMLSRESKIDALLIDIMMPEMDGYEAMRRIRAQPKWQAVPIIALTARAMQGEEQRCLQAGATAYQSKPVDAARLLPLLAKLLGP